VSNRYPDNLDVNENSSFALVGSVTNSKNGSSFIVLLAAGSIDEYQGDEQDRQDFIEDLRSNGIEVREMDGQTLSLVTDMVYGQYDGDMPLA
jgi:hypothetical protein